MGQRRFLLGGILLLFILGACRTAVIQPQDEPDGGVADADLVGDPGADEAGPCAGLAGAEPAGQVAFLEADPGCAWYFVELLLAEPFAHLTAFYALVPSPAASEALWSAVTDRIFAGTFVFAAPVIDDLHAHLPDAVAACGELERCGDWETYVLSALRRGDLFDCPDPAGLDNPALLGIVPYGGYSCIEAAAQVLAPKLDEATLLDLLDLASSHAWGWARRSAIRVIGRAGERPEGDPAHTLVAHTQAAAVTGTLAGRLEVERDSDALADAIWVLDAIFLPYFPMQPALAAIAADTGYPSEVRFQALAAVARLISCKTGLLPGADVDFVIAMLSADDPWLRAEAAYLCETLRDEQLDAGIQARLVAALTAAHDAETALLARAYQARALDRFNDTALFAQLLEDYEAAHLAYRLSAGDLAVRSGLPGDELPAFLERMQREREAFFALLGTGFVDPVPGDPLAPYTLVLFATRAEYIEYMSAFVGYGAWAGGFYLEATATLYTYQREPEESRYTVLQLIQHEFGHALQARHVYPGLWGDPGTFDEPRGWADEGLAEVMGGYVIEGDSATLESRPEHLEQLCDRPYRDLAGLLAQRAGYDEDGSWDYPNGWAFDYFLWTTAAASARSLYAAFRAGSYRLADFAALADVPSVASLEGAWHAALDGWCRARPAPLLEDPGGGSRVRPPVLHLGVPADHAPKPGGRYR